MDIWAHLIEYRALLVECRALLIEYRAPLIENTALQRRGGMGGRLVAEDSGG